MKWSLRLAIVLTVVTCLMAYYPTIVMIWTGALAIVLWGMWAYAHGKLLDYLK